MDQKTEQKGSLKSLEFDLGTWILLEVTEKTRNFARAGNKQGLIKFSG